MTIKELKQNIKSVKKQLLALELSNKISSLEKSTLRSYYFKKLNDFQEQIDQLKKISYQ